MSSAKHDAGESSAPGLTDYCCAERVPSWLAILLGKGQPANLRLALPGVADCSTLT